MEGEFLLRTMLLLSRHLPERWQSRTKTDDNIFSLHFNIYIIFLVHVIRLTDEFLYSHHPSVCKCSVDVRGNKILINLHSWFYIVYCVSGISIIILAPQELHPLDLKNGVANFINEVCSYVFFLVLLSFQSWKLKIFLHVIWIDTKTERLVQEMLYINNSLYLSRKYAAIFVRGHYLFREANVFLRA